MARNRTSSMAAAMAASLLLATLAAHLRAQPPDQRHSTVDREVQSLKAAYLRCERSATERLLGIDEAAGCSTAYERLLALGFGGDFQRLLAWWKAERLAQAREERITRP